MKNGRFKEPEPTKYKPIKYRGFKVLLAVIVVLGVLVLGASRIVVMWGANTWVVHEGDSIQEKLDAAAAVSSATNHQTVLVMPGRYEQQLIVDSSDYSYITLTGLAWAAFSTTIFTDEDTDSNNDGTHDCEGALIIGGGNTLVEYFIVANLSFENWNSGYDAAECLPPEPAIKLYHYDAGTEEMGSFSWDNIYLQGLYVRGAHDGIQVTEPHLDTDTYLPTWLPTLHIKDSYVYSGHDPFTVKCAGIYYLKNDYWVSDYNICRVGNEDTKWKSAAMHFNNPCGDGKTSSILAGSILYSEDETFIVKSAASELNASGQDYVAGILFYMQGLGMERVIFKNPVIDVEFDLDDTSVDLSGVVVAGIQHGNALNMPETTIINPIITVKQNADHAYAPDVVAGIVSDGANDGTANFYIHNPIIQVSNAKAASNAYAIYKDTVNKPTTSIDVFGIVNFDADTSGDWEYYSGNEQTSAPTVGTATLSSGTITVTTEAITATSRVFLSGVGSTNEGYLSLGTVVAGTSFDIDSSNGSDARNVHWRIED